MPKAACPPSVHRSAGSIAGTRAAPARGRAALALLAGALLLGGCASSAPAPGLRADDAPPPSTVEIEASPPARGPVEPPPVVEPARPAEPGPAVVAEPAPEPAVVTSEPARDPEPAPIVEPEPEPDPAPAPAPPPEPGAMALAGRLAAPASGRVVVVALRNLSRHPITEVRDAEARLATLLGPAAALVEPPFTVRPAGTVPPPAGALRLEGSAFMLLRRGVEQWELHLDLVEHAGGAEGDGAVVLWRAGGPVRLVRTARPRYPQLLAWPD